MPLLSFQVQADYDKVIRLRSEIEKLKSEMKSVNAVFDADRFNSYNKRLKEATTEFNALVDSAAKAGAKVNSSVQAMSRTVDLSNPTKELKKFDGQVDELCKHLNAYFDFLKGKLQDTLNMLNEVGSIADKVNVDDKNVGHIEELKRQNAELTSEIQRQIAAYEEQQSRFQALSDAIRTNNVPALQQLAEQEDEASKRLKLDEARNSLKGVTDDMKSLAAQMAETQGDVERLESLLDSLKNSHLDDGNAIKDSQYLETEQALESAREKLVGMKKEYNEMAILQKQYSDQVQQTNGHQERLRTQIMNAREDMVKLIAAGQAGTPTFNEIVSQTGKMRRELALANAYMQYFADPDRNLATLKQSMEGAAGGASLLVGVMGLFNQKSEEMEMIQTKLQSLLGIIVGLETTYAAVKKTSNVMIAIGQIQSWASAKAKAAETVATEAGTVPTIKATTAQAMFNTVAKANPYLALLSIITLVVGGIYTLAKALGSETDEQKKAAEAAKEHAEEIRKQHEAWAHSVANSAAKQIMSYKNLQKKWEELGNDLKAKEKFVTDNKTAFNDLGFSVDNVTQAENLLIKNTDAVVNAIMARAKAAAYEKVATEELERQIRIELEKGTVANGAYRKNFKKGQRLSLDEARELESESGMSIVGANSKGATKGVAFSTDVEVVNAEKLNEASKKAAENRRKRYLADRTKRIQESKDKVKLIQDNARQEYEAEKNAIQQTGVPQFITSSHGGKRGKGTTADDVEEKKTDVLSKQKLAQERAAKDLEFSTREAQIKAMQDGTDKVLAQIELDREREEEAIRRSYEDMRLKRIEEARKVWEADPKNKGKNFYDTQEYAQANTNTQEETDNRDERMKAVLAQYNKSLEEQRRQEVQAMYDYLQEYGTLEQKRLAIAEKYAELIKEAEESGDFAKAEGYRQQQKQEESTLQLDKIKAQIDWEGLFNNLGQYSAKFLTDIRGRLQELLKDPNISPENAKVISEKIGEIDNVIIEKTENTFHWINDYLAEQERLLSEAKLAEDNYKNAVEEANSALGEKESARQNVEKLLTDMTGISADNMKGMGIDLSKLTSKNGEEIFSKLGFDTASEKGKILKEALDKLAAAELKAATAAGKAEKAEGKYVTAQAKTKQTTAEKVAGVLGGFNEDVQKYLGPLSGIADKLGLGELSEKLESGMNAMNSAAGAAASFASGDYLGAAMQGIDAVSSFLDIFGGGDDAAEKAEKERKEKDRIANLLEITNSRIEKLNDTLKESYGLKAIEVAEKQKREYDDLFGYYVEAIGKAVLNGIAGLHMFIRETNSANRDAIKKVEEIFVGESPEEGAKYIYENMDKPGFFDFLYETDLSAEKIEEIINYIKELGKAYGESITVDETLLQQLTQTSYQQIEDSYFNMLMDMEGDTEDWANNIAKIMASALLKNMIFDEAWQKKQKKWLQDYQEAVKTGDTVRMNDLKQQQKEWAEEDRKTAQTYMEAVGYDENGKEQKASANGIEKITHEDAGAIEGRLTATQIAVEQGNTKKDAILAQATMMNVTMSDMRSLSATQCEIADDTRDILANSYLELREANDHLGKIEKAVGNIQTIAEDTKKIVDDRL